jgi:DNA-directed RNA polymerase alpha subunit
MSDIRSKPIDLLEVSVLSMEIFEHLGLKTIGDLADTTEADFYAAAEALAGDRRWRPAGREVKEILADMGLSLRSS